MTTNPTDSMLTTDPGLSLLDLIKMEQHLHKQKLDAKIAVKESTSAEESLGRNEDELHQLTLEHHDVYTNFYTKANFVKRVQLTTEALRCVFPELVNPGSSPDSPSQLSLKSRRIQELMDKQKFIITELLSTREKIQEKNVVLDKLKRRNQELRHSNRRAMLDIKTATDQAHRSNRQTQRAIKAEEDLQKVVDRITVQRNVYQLLIVGSGVNWAQDQRLLDLVVQLSQQPKLDS